MAPTVEELEREQVRIDGRLKSLESLPVDLGRLDSEIKVELREIKGDIADLKQAMQERVREREREARDRAREKEAERLAREQREERDLSARTSFRRWMVTTTVACSAIVITAIGIIVNTSGAG